MAPESNHDAPGKGGLLVPFLFAVLVFLLVSHVASFVLMNRQLTQTTEIARAYQMNAEAIVSERVAEATAGLQGEVNRMAAAAGQEETGEFGDYEIINGHDHLYFIRNLDNYLPAAEATGIKSTVFVASSFGTLRGGDNSPSEGNAWNSEEIIRASQQHPGKVIPYCTIHPSDEDKVAILEGHRAAGAQGVKLYSGHGTFYERPLTDESMQAVYAWCEQESFPICWHVNFSRADIAGQFEEVMAKYPKLKVIVPHFGVTFYRPGDAQWTRFWALLDQYPGLYTDCSWGTREILVHGLEVVSANVEAFREKFEQYQDRIVWGTDMVVTGNSEKTVAWIESVLRACRGMLEKEVYYFWMAADGCQYAFARTKNPQGRLQGLALSPEVLGKVYATNYQNFAQLKL
jgi:predicted TIM-barrel fold metal-dependent hydrolase